MMCGMIKIITFFCCAACFCLAVGGCNYSTHAEGAELWGKIGAFIFDTIRKAETVEYAALAPSLPGSGNQEYKAASKEISLTADQAAQIKKLLLTDSNYQFNVLKKCVFVPESAFTFKRGESTVRVLISMGCKQLRFVQGDQGTRFDIDPGAEAIADFINHLSKS